MAKEEIIGILVLIVLNLLMFWKVIRVWKADCKEYGEENLAVPLRERLTVLLYFVGLELLAFFGRRK